MKRLAMLLAVTLALAAGSALAAAPADGSDDPDLLPEPEAPHEQTPAAESAPAMGGPAGADASCATCDGALGFKRGAAAADTGTGAAGSDDVEAADTGTGSPASGEPDEADTGTGSAGSDGVEAADMGTGSPASGELDAADTGAGSASASDALERSSERDEDAAPEPDLKVTALPATGGPPRREELGFSAEPGARDPSATVRARGDGRFSVVVVVPSGARTEIVLDGEGRILDVRSVESPQM